MQNKPPANNTPAYNSDKKKKKKKKPSQMKDFLESGGLGLAGLLISSVMKD